MGEKGQSLRDTETRLQRSVTFLIILPGSGKTQCINWDQNLLLTVNCTSPGTLGSTEHLTGSRKMNELCPVTSLATTSVLCILHETGDYLSILL